MHNAIDSLQAAAIPLASFIVLHGATRYEISFCPILAVLIQSPPSFFCTPSSLLSGQCKKLRSPWLNIQTAMQHCYQHYSHPKLQNTALYQLLGRKLSLSQQKQGQTVKTYVPSKSKRLFSSPQAICWFSVLSAWSAAKNSASLGDWGFFWWYARQNTLLDSSWATEFLFVFL